ncbi:MAG: enoyl-CoA hydratase/isomerase family protein [Deltaproteobacteria bacterium]|nr:enoyl-CoA hydratase/isomerase family protein [Deltaproteobacteria bacterium]MBI2229055.1 enoyl-CoA hydratase/isomerase family protein [Deltaproteobacteria bacterium]
MSYQNILTERVDKIGLITLNRPEKLNAMSYELACELDEELTKIENDDNVRVVILTGAGPRAFSAGGDIHQMVKSTPEEMAARSEVRSQANWHLATFAKPIIGAINGLAYGAGALLTSMLDIRIGCEHAEIQFLAAKYGRANSTWSLPLVVGMPKAKELLFTGRPVKAEEAERIGLLNQVVPCAQLREAALQMAQQIAENDARMVQGIKKLLNDGIGMPWHERYDSEQNARKSKMKPTSPREGFKAFLERKGIRG